MSRNFFSYLRGKTAQGKTAVVLVVVAAIIAIFVLSVLLSRESLESEAIAVKPTKSCQEKLSEARLSPNIQFQASQSRLTGAQSVKDLNHLARVFKSCTDVVLVIRAHSDKAGDPAFNTNLTRDRAELIVDYLIKGGVSKQMLSFEGVGGQEPIATNETEAGRARNNRIEFRVLDEALE